MSRRWKVWKEEEDFKLRCAYERTGPQVSSYEFWNRVFEDFFEFYPHRSRTAVQQRGHLLGLLSKKVPSEKYICISCGRLGVHNRKRGLCLRCYGVLQHADFKGCQDGPGEVQS